jgi:hypothetical protein
MEEDIYNRKIENSETGEQMDDEQKRYQYGRANERRGMAEQMKDELKSEPSYVSN